MGWGLSRGLRAVQQRIFVNGFPQMHKEILRKSGVHVSGDGRGLIRVTDRNMPGEQPPCAACSWAQ